MRSGVERERCTSFVESGDADHKMIGVAMSMANVLQAISITLNTRRRCAGLC